MTSSLYWAVKALIAQNAELKKWKDEDPRMLREQIRVADEAYQRLVKENTELKRKLIVAGCCGVCWTNSWEPTDEADTEAVEDPNNPGLFMRCAHCYMMEGFIKLNERHTSLERELAQLQEQLDSWRQHAAESDREFLQLEDWLIGNKECDTKTGIINRAAVCKDRIRDLIAKEGELGDLQEQNAELRRERDDLKSLIDQIVESVKPEFHSGELTEFLRSLLTLNRELVEALKELRSRHFSTPSRIAAELKADAVLSKSAQMEGGTGLTTPPTNAT